ncbi:conjugal transfer mating pair stabilization protein TraN [Marinobacter sp. F3R08]|uniref:conjugal transfer mating pair stabilization protein TraN n=1 Tax=Marinobacter sp. F3R08 TaxID=2841559 RepID=UPI001C091A22|nr:conjugal transfer mating pair stabilization protein TraN [Marinobacter sp. F3R08]MBU2952248.1 conjugal transfer mating pair stabilization protein TraN [Marinobacter sp. F3R08]
MFDALSPISIGQRLLAGFLAWLMFFAPVLAFAADDPRLPPAQISEAQTSYREAATDPNASPKEQGMRAGRFGTQIGKSIGANAVQPSFNANGNINLGTTTNEEGMVFDREADAGSFFSGTSGGAQDPSTVAFPGSQQPNIDDLKNGTHQSLAEDSPAFRSALYNDANRDEPQTVMGGAYKVLLNDANRVQPDLRNDPVFSRTRTTYNQVESLTDEFSDCSISRQIQETSDRVRIPEYKSCRRIQDNSEECTIEHDYTTTGVIELASGTNANLSHYTSGAGNYFLGWIGRVGDNYWDGDCSIFEQQTQYRVLNPDAIEKVTIVYAKWDDYMQIRVGAPGSERSVWSGPDGNFPPETGGECELGVNWSENLDVDITQQFKNTAPGGLINFKIRVSVTGAGEGYARLKIDYDTSKTIEDNGWVPSSDTCLDSANSTLDDYISGGLECLDGPPVDSNGCFQNDYGVLICPDDFEDVPVEFNPSCREVSVAAQYTFYTGEHCYVDRGGNEICTEVPQSAETGEITDCREFEDNNQCSYVGTECVDGTEGEVSGTCYIQSETWDCGEWVDVDDYDSTQNVQCDGEFLCQGDSCSDVENTESESFNKAAAMLQAANFMAMDGECTELDINENRTCTVFGGDASECKMVGLPELGIEPVNCCDQPVDVGPGQYIGLMSKMGAMDSAFTMIDPSMPFSGARGAYQALRDPLTSTFTEVTQPFTKAVESVTGPIKDAVVDNITEPLSTFLDELKQKLADQLQQFFTEQGLQGAGNTAGGAAGSGITESSAQQGANMLGAAGNVLGTIMGAYTAVMAAYLALQIIYECTEDEIELAVKRELKSCSKVGSYCAQEVCVAPTGFGCAAWACAETRDSYCCYNSPLSRIVMEQAGPQLGRPGSKGMGEARNPYCAGIPLDDLAELDWDRIDLTEWTGLLALEGALKTGPEDLTFDALTGSGSAFAMPEMLGDRDDSVQRTIDRVSTGSPDDTRVHQRQNFSFDPD